MANPTKKQRFQEVLERAISKTGKILPKDVDQVGPLIRGMKTSNEKSLTLEFLLKFFLLGLNFLSFCLVILYC